MDTEETGLYHILIFTIVVTCGILLYAFITAILQQVQYRVQHNREVESEILTCEKERRRLAADMHDDLGPMLSAVKLTLSGIRKENEADLELVDESMYRIDEISGKIRTLARGLMPGILIDKGLAMALQQFIKTLRVPGDLKIELLLQPIPILNVNASIHIYRIVQEIIHNCIKHAHAHLLVIKLYILKDQLILAASDDGIGFKNTKKKQQPDGYGLTSIKNRVHLLNGKLNMRYRPCTGYFIQLPLACIKEGITMV